VAPGEAGQGAHHPVVESLQGFATVRPESGVALTPAPRLLGPAGRDLLVRQAFQMTEMPLAQAGVEAQGQLLGLGNGLGRGAGPLQIAAVDGLQRLTPQGVRHPFGLPQAGVVQRNVRVALDAAFGIPGGFPVADGEDAGGVLKHAP
jgi:hypothetical protein